MAMKGVYMYEGKIMYHDGSIQKIKLNDQSRIWSIYTRELAAGNKVVIYHNGQLFLGREE